MATFLESKIYWDNPAEEPQRSMVRRVSLRFDAQVTLPPAAVDWQRTGPSPLPAGSVAFSKESEAAQPDGTWLVILKAATGGVTLEVSGSLTDGNYTIHVDGSQVVDGNNNPLGSDVDLAFHRLFGDSNGDSTVDIVDKNVFDAAYRSRVGMSAYKVYLDFDADHDIDGADKTQFSLRFGKTI